MTAAWERGVRSSSCQGLMGGRSPTSCFSEVRAVEIHNTRFLKNLAALVASSLTVVLKCSSDNDEGDVAPTIVDARTRGRNRLETLTGKQKERALDDNNNNNR
eukprot:scaffold25038_cov76-Amphora_coffeaeformis.AAC.1